MRVRPRNRRLMLLASLLHSTAAFSANAVSPSPKTLITFDVDGTLVQGSAGSSAEASAHSNAFGYACGKVLGTGSPTKHVAKALPTHLYHGSTDGLILCRLARAELGIEEVSQSQLDAMMDTMYEYIAALEDDEVARGIEPLPGVLDHLKTLAAIPSDQVACGLVTGNVEGIARRKMRAVGVFDTKALAPAAADQLRRTWRGSEDLGFLGGFGSCFCSRNIDDANRNYLDRAEQLAIAARRAASQEQGDHLRRVVHVGDAPADVLAAKAYAEGSTTTSKPGDCVCVSMVAVATGSYSADELRELAGEPIPGQWEPIVLEQGMADPYFLEACGL